MSTSKQDEQDETEKRDVKKEKENNQNQEPEDEEGRKEKDLKECLEKLEKYKKQAEENLNGWKRAKADFINYKKDQERWMEEFRKYANEDIITRLLQIIDGFHLAIEHLPEDLKNSDWAKGIICIKGQLESFLKEVGVEEIKSIGEKFNPSLFESVGEEESDKEEGIVVAEVQKGYKMFGKVIRASKVKISKKVNIKQESNK